MVRNYQFVGRKPLLSRYLTGAWVATPSLPMAKVRLFAMALVTSVELRELYIDTELFCEIFHDMRGEDFGVGL